MPSRRVTVLVVAIFVATGGLLWRSAFGGASEPSRAVVRTLSEIARARVAPLALLTEGEQADGLVRKALAETDAPPVTIIAREPKAIEAAARGGTLLAGRHGRAYLEVLGYRAAWVPSPASQSFPFARVEGRLRCAAVRGDAWSPLPGLEYTGRLGIVLPPAASGAMLLVVGDEFPLDVDVEPVDGTLVRMRRDVLPSVAAAPPDYWIEGPSPRDAPGQIQQLTLLATPGREGVLSVRLGRRAPRVLARLRGYADGTRASVCAAPTGADEAFRDSSTSLVVLPDLASYFGTGWSDARQVPNAGNVRWMGPHGALLVPLARRGTVRLALDAYRSPDAGSGEVSLRINDIVDVSGLRLRPGLQRYEWTVPSAAWVTGTNEVLVRVSSEGDERLLAFARLELSLVP